MNEEILDEGVETPTEETQEVVDDTITSTDPAISIKIEDGESYDIRGVKISGFGNIHAEIYKEYGQVQNTGYMIENLCYAGDAFHYPDAEVDILALPVAGPWMKIKDAIDYAKNINPRIVFPVHDAYIHDWAKFIWDAPEKFLAELGIKFKKPELGKEEEI